MNDSILTFLDIIIIFGTNQFKGSSLILLYLDGGILLPWQIVIDQSIVFLIQIFYKTYLYAITINLK